MMKITRYLVAAAMVFILCGAVTALSGCEKREYHRHEEKVQKDVVIEEGPIVE